MQAQDKIFANVDELREDKGTVVTTLQKVQRSMTQIYMYGGADYNISSSENKDLSKYLKSRCYAVQIGDSLYVNCKKMRYHSYRFGNWYASAMRVGDYVYFIAQPVGQEASESIKKSSVSKLPGSVGDAIDASNLSKDRVVYELDLNTGRSTFVGRKRMQELLSGHPDMLRNFNAEDSERAEVVIRYLKQL